MAWGFTQRERPWATTYEGIKRYFNATKPWRSGPSNIRPISDNRRRSNEFIRERSDGAYECVYHHTAVVTYAPDGTIALSAGGWNTQNTAAFAHTYSPFRVNLDRYRVVISTGQGDYAITKGPLMFRGGQYVDGAETQKRLTLDKRKAAEARKQPRFVELLAVADALNRLEERSLPAFRDTSSMAGKALYWYLQGDETYYDFALRLASVNDRAWMAIIAYFAFGAVERVEVPLGQIMAPSTYDAFSYLMKEV